MKKKALLLLSALLIFNSCTIYANENLKNDSGSAVIEEKSNAGFNTAHAFIDESGTMYYNLQYINELIGLDNFYYGFDNKTDTAYIQVSVLLEDYPEFAQYFLFKDGETIVKYNTGEENLGKKVIVKDDSIFIPLRAFLNVLQIGNDSIVYNAGNKTVDIINVNNFPTEFRKVYYKKARENYLIGSEYSNLIRVNKDVKCLSEIYLVYDDVKYIEETKNGRSIAEYIKKNFDSSFDLADYKIVEMFESGKAFSYNGEFVFDQTRLVNFIYQKNGIDTNSGYAAAYDDNNKVVAILPYNMPVSQ